jgi:hypothetical protein
VSLLVRASAFSGIGLLVFPATAHHSPAMFDMTKEVVFEGTVTEVDWRNPHVYFALSVTDASGRKREQRIEAGPASNMVTSGMTADSLKVGDKVVVQAKPNRTNQSGTALGWTVMKGGVVMPLHVRAMAPVTAGTAVATSIAGTWVPTGTGFTGLERESHNLALTDTGRAAMANGAEAKTKSRAACVPFGPPPIMALPSTIVVEVDAKTVTFKLDAMSATRVVHLDQPTHPANLAPSVQGHSIGHWDGSTLVVDTVGYAPHPEGLAFDLPTSAKKHIAERFALSADGKRIEYEAVVEDPEYYTAPIRHRSEWNYRPDQKPSGLPCDLEAARRFSLPQ